MTDITYLLELTDADLFAISRGLGEIPHKIAEPLLVKLRGQVREQVESKKDGNHAHPHPNRHAEETQEVTT